MRLPTPADRSVHTSDFEAIGTLMPVLRAATRYFINQLEVRGVPVRLPSDCLAEFVTQAAEVVASTPRPEEPYTESLNRHLRTRAQFILTWTTTHERFGKELRELVQIARRFDIPRPPRSEAVAPEVNFDLATGQ